ncbi:hypothetical protein FA15DRAFT_704208 [Coprinopsis marcescibilis]|uniref:G domain-containing protein n=1 Tax=Coprinopsis marcescibilis TaxID=230819 RepID=A0A5C3KYH4_COPMA|nr:hypothetical protein FA15DRAFT_704208 [Coprinopsis marcescibilis]
MTLDHFTSMGAKHRNGEDSHLQDGSENDILIVVMGPPGAGKSSFIHNLLDDQAPSKPTVSHKYKPCTENVEHYSMVVTEALVQGHDQLQGLQGKRIVLLDTPGFDDCIGGVRSDYGLLHRVALWVASSYSQDVQVAALLYIYPIYPFRFTHTEGKNLQLFSKLCGPCLMPRVMMATSNWEYCSNMDRLQSRERDLTEDYWKGMLDAGAAMERLDGRRVGEFSAHALLVKMLDRMISSEQDWDGSILSLQFQVLGRRRSSKGRIRLKERIDAVLKECNYMGDTENVRRKALGLVREEEQGPASWGDRWLKPLLRFVSLWYSALG